MNALPLVLMNALPLEGLLGPAITARFPLETFRHTAATPSGGQAAQEFGPRNFRSSISLGALHHLIPINAAILQRFPHNSLIRMFFPPNVNTGFPSTCWSAFFGDATIAISSP